MMKCTSQSRAGMTKFGFLFGAILWCLVAFLIYRLGAFGTLIKEQAPASNDPTNAQTSHDADSAPDSPEDAVASTANSASEPIVLSPSDNSVRINFPSRELPEFEFPECMGGTVSRDSLKGQRWVASFVFTRCVTTCPIITRNLMELQKRVPKSESDIKFVTFSVNSSHDTAEVLKSYSEIYSADHERWKFLTGDEDTIHSLIRDGFAQVVLPTVGEERKPGYEVAHSNRVVLVNEDSIPVATYLATRDEDIVKLRRVLEGKDPFPQPSSISGFSFSNPPSAPVNVEIRKSDDPKPAQSGDTGPESSQEETEINQTNPADALEKGKSGPSDSADEQTEALSAVRLYPNSLTAALPGVATISIPNFTGLMTAYRPTDETRQLQQSAESTPEAANSRIEKLLPSWAVALPKVNAILNGTSTVLLLLGITAIKKKNQSLHKNFMISAFLVSVLFLLSYLTYHYALGEYTGEHGRRFVGSQIASVVYMSILIPHIILAIFVPFLAIRVFQHAFASRWEEHRRLARITFPIWLFVSVTGVVIYWMLYQWPAPAANALAVN